MGRTLPSRRPGAGHPGRDGEAFSGPHASLFSVAQGNATRRWKPRHENGVQHATGDPRLARLAKDFDVEGLLAVVQSDVIPEVMWAVEVLELAPDDRLDLLLPRLADTEKVAVRSLYGKHANGGGAGQVCPDGRPFGAVARFLLWSRLSLAAPMDPAVWAENAVSPEALGGLRAAWLGYRASKSRG